MKWLVTILTFTALSLSSLAQTKCIHVFVALCDNENQGIVPVPSSLGNGQDPNNNLYWGAAYGVRSYLKYKTADWKLVKKLPSEDPIILERLLFKHADQDLYLLADAFDGAYIKDCIEQFLMASNRQGSIQVSDEGKSLVFGGGSDLVAYIGHDGLMEFSVELEYKNTPKNPVEVIILACYSKDFFEPEIAKAGAQPLLWTTHLMAPEAYTLKAAIDGWIQNETGEQVEERAAQIYNKYQKCGMTGARGLFTTGF